MTQFGNCPIGFEDGRITSYEAGSNGLIVRYEFWNGKKGQLIFTEFRAVRDNDALDVTIGSANEENPSGLIAEVLAHLYAVPPDGVEFKHYQFLDLDDFPVFEVVAEACSFSEEV